MEFTFCGRCGSRTEKRELFRTFYDHCPECDAPKAKGKFETGSGVWSPNDRNPCAEVGGSYRELKGQHSFLGVDLGLFQPGSVAMLEGVRFLVKNVRRTFNMGKLVACEATLETYQHFPGTTRGPMLLEIEQDLLGDQVSFRDWIHLCKSKGILQ